jgi:hypothetical protein
MVVILEGWVQKEMMSLRVSAILLSSSEQQWHTFCLSLNHIIKPDFGSNTSVQIAYAALKNIAYQSSLESYGY